MNSSRCSLLRRRKMDMATVCRSASSITSLSQPLSRLLSIQFLIRHDALLNHGAVPEVCVLHRLLGLIQVTARLAVSLRRSLGFVRFVFLAPELDSDGHVYFQYRRIPSTAANTPT